MFKAYIVVEGFPGRPPEVACAYETRAQAMQAMRDRAAEAREEFLPPEDDLYGWYDLGGRYLELMVSEETFQTRSDRDRFVDWYNLA